MAAKVEIANRALRLIKQRPIQAFTDTGRPEADACAYFYPIVLKDALAMRTWSFATTTLDLDEHSEDPPTDWAYRYEYPTNVANVVKLLTTGSDPMGPGEDFKVEQIEDGTALTLLANVTPAALRFVRSDPNSDLFPFLFDTALAYRLAAELSAALAQDKDGFDKWYARSVAAMDEAMILDAANTRVMQQRGDGGAIAARGGVS